MNIPEPTEDAGPELADDLTRTKGGLIVHLDPEGNAEVVEDTTAESNPNSRAARRRQAREAWRANAGYVEHPVAAPTVAGQALQLMSRTDRRARGVRVPFDAIR